MVSIIKTKDAPIVGSAYRISAYRCAIARIGIGKFVADTSELIIELSMRKQIIADRMRYTRARLSHNVKTRLLAHIAAAASSPVVLCSHVEEKVTRLGVF